MGYFASDEMRNVAHEKTETKTTYTHTKRPYPNRLVTPWR